MVCELMGSARRVTARLATRVNAIEVEDCAAVILEMESGALVTLAATLGSAVEISRLRACFANVTLESGTTAYHPGGPGWTITPDGPDAETKIEAALRQVAPSLPRFGGQLQAYHAALTSGGPLPVTLADARRSLELVTAIYHAAETGQPVALPIGADHPKYHSWAPASLQAA
jgi:predicted dehydrogenase